MKLSFLFLFSIASLALYAQVSAPSVETSFRNYIDGHAGGINSGSVLPTFLIKEDTKGNRYLFEKWVPGTITTVQGAYYNSPNMELNYDKMARKLLMLVDKSKVIELSSEDLSAFSVRDNTMNYVFERLKNSADLNFYQPIYKNEKGYSFYKLLSTKLKKADFQTNGIIESGNKYDEFVDTEQYYFLTAKGELLKISNFKKKTLKEVLGNEAPKVDSYFKAHRSDPVDEEFIKNMLISING
jgi:hypothetical protein